jgi:phosphonatase-like hydrolase
VHKLSKAIRVIDFILFIRYTSNLSGLGEEIKQTLHPQAILQSVIHYKFYSMTIKLLIFDMAGTTVKDNDNVHAALQQAFATEGIQVSRNEANDVMGYPKPVAIKDLLTLKGYTGPQDAFIQKIFENFQEEMVQFYQHDPQVREIEGVSDLFALLHKHHMKIAIDTGFDRRIADTILNRFGWREKGLIDVSVTSDEVANGRPYPDLQQGTVAGCKYVVGVTTGAYTREALQKEPHTHIINQLSDLLPILDIQKVLTNH